VLTCNSNALLIIVHTNERNDNNNNKDKQYLCSRAVHILIIITSVPASCFLIKEYGTDIGIALHAVNEVWLENYDL